jgi:nucleoside-diphosphate-sugar epimerase
MTEVKIPTALVTGATGFIGKTLCTYLSDNGFKVHALTRQINPILYKKNNIKWIVGDITKPESLTGICDDVDIVFHLAGFAHAFEEENKDFSMLHQQVNHQGTINILNEAKKAHIKRFIYFSSTKACADSHTCIDESWNTLPTDAYGIAKRAAEEAVLVVCKENHIIPVILRPSLVYGEGVKGNLAAMLKGISKGYFPTPAPIQNHRSMISCKDLCRAALLAATVNNLQHHIFIVTDGVAYSTFDIVQMMRQALGKKQSRIYLPLWIWYGLAKMGDIGQHITKKRLPINTQVIKKLFSNAAYSSQLIKNELQFEPQFSLRDILPSMIRVQRNDG